MSPASTWLHKLRSAMLRSDSESLGERPQGPKIQTTEERRENDAVQVFHWMASLPKR